MIKIEFPIKDRENLSKAIELVQIFLPDSISKKDIEIVKRLLTALEK